jgi:hypothetical protein
MDALEKEISGSWSISSRDPALCFDEQRRESQQVANTPPVIGKPRAEKPARKPKPK